MAEPWEWTEQDLLDLITNGVQKNLNLDYKQKESLGEPNEAILKRTLERCILRATDGKDPARS